MNVVRRFKICKVSKDFLASIEAYSHVVHNKYLNSRSTRHSLTLQINFHMQIKQSQHYFDKFQSTEGLKVTNHSRKPCSE